MHILYVFPEPFPINRARGVQVAHSVCALASQGVILSFVYITSGVSDPFLSYGIKKPETVTLVPLISWTFHKLPLHSNKLFFCCLRKWLKRTLKKNLSPDFIIVRHIKLASFLSQNFPDIPLLYEAHEVFAEVAPENKRAKIYEIERMVLEKSTIVIANSSGTAKKILSRYHINRKIFVLPNGVAIPENLPEKHWEESRLHVIYTGSLFDWKGVQYLVEAARWLPGFRITIIGGEQHQIEKLRKYITPNGAEVIFHGHLPHKQTIELVNSSCIAVLPNRNDENSAFTSPLKLFEYMASGCAIVASDIQSIREIVGDSEVMWFEPANPKSLADAIKKLASDPQTARRMGERLRRKAYDYTWESRAKKQINIIREANVS